MQLLVIKIHDLNKNPDYSLLGKKQLQERFTSADWKHIRSLTRGRKVIILLPSNEIVLTSAIIPSKNRKQLLQAIPFALEDTLAEDVENLHFAVHQDNDSTDNKSHVAIINRTVLTEILNLLKTNGIVANYVLPSLLSQKVKIDTWSIDYTNTDDNNSASVRLGKYDGFVSDQSMLEMFVSEQLENQTPKAIYSNVKLEDLPETLHDIPYNHVESDVLDYESTVSALPLNLLTNFIRTNQQTSSINWKAWKPAAILGGVLTTIWMGIFFWQSNQLKNQSNQLKTQIQQVYKDTFPNGRLVDASAQMQSALRALKVNTGQTIESPLPLISNMGPLLKEYKDMILSELRYQENQLSMTIESPNLTRLESFKRDAADKNNLRIEIKDSTTTANKVKAVILISPLPNTTANKNDSDNSKQGNS